MSSSRTNLQHNQSGWDWFSLQLSDGSEIMLFELRRKDGTLDPFSAGTYVDPQGRSMHLSAKDFSLDAGKNLDQPEFRRPLSDRMERSSSFSGFGRRHHHPAAAAGTGGQDARRTHLLGGRDRGDRDQKRAAAQGPGLSGNDRICGPGSDGRVGRRLRFTFELRSAEWRSATPHPDKPRGRRKGSSRISGS